MKEVLERLKETAKLEKYIEDEYPIKDILKQSKIVEKYVVKLMKDKYLKDSNNLEEVENLEEIAL